MINEKSGDDPLESIKNLSVAERILIVEEIWDSIVNSNEEFTLSDEQKKELDKRLEAYNCRGSKVFLRAGSKVFPTHFY